MNEKPRHNTRVPVVCPLCVQWRCAACKSDDWPMCCDKAYDNDGSEPYRPDGSVAVLTQDEYCESCQQAMDQYQQLHADENNY